MTDKECIVTAQDKNKLHTLRTRVINFKNRYIKIVDEEQQLKNVTIKYFQCEMSEIFIK